MLDSKYFKKREFACKCGCGFDDIDPHLVELLTQIREHFNRPVIVTSGCRCVKHNKAVGGASRSMHLQGKAADIQVKGVAPKDVQDYLDRVLPADRYGVGYHSRFTHIDTRENAARFDY